MSFPFFFSFFFLFIYLNQKKEEKRKAVSRGGYPKFPIALGGCS
jgi:hypothetical protein